MTDSPKSVPTPGRYRLGRWRLVLVASLAVLLAGALGGYAWWRLGRPIVLQGEPYVYNPGPEGDLCPRRDPGLRGETSRLPDIPHLVTHEGHVLPSRRVRSYSYSTNSEAFRGTRDLPRTKRPGVYRIGVFGTGVSFGNGVDDEWPWPLLLEQRLELAEQTFEVYNLAIPGSTTDDGTVLLDQLAGEMDFDLVIFCYGVNDGLTHKQRPVALYRLALDRLLRLRARHGLDMLFAIEPRSSFYPWPYEGHEAAFRELLGGVDGPILDLPRELDLLERQHGLRLEKDSEVQRVVEYRGGRPRVLFETPWDPDLAVERLRGVVWHHQVWDEHDQPIIIEEHYQPDKGVQSVSPDVYDYLDTHWVDMANFIDGVHLNEQGHVEVARLVHEELRRRGVVQ